MTFDRRLALAKAKQHLLFHNETGAMIERSKIMSIGGFFCYEDIVNNVHDMKGLSAEQSYYKRGYR